MSDPFAWVKKQSINIIILLAIVGGLYSAHRYVIHKEVKKAEAAITLVYAKEKLKAIEKAAVAQIELTDSLVTEIKKKNEQIKAADARISVILSELRKRPSRETRNTVTTEARSSCTGGELYREDGEFLTREAARAEKLIAERDFYYNSYENARKQIEKLKNGN